MSGFILCCPLCKERTVAYSPPAGDAHWNGFFSANVGNTHSLKCLPYKGNYSNPVSWNTLPVDANTCSKRKWEAKKGFWRKNRVGQTGLKKKRLLYCRTFRTFCMLIANWILKRGYRLTAALLSNGPRDTYRVNVFLIYIYIHIHMILLNLKNKVLCSAQNIPRRGDTGHILWPPHCKSRIWKKNLLIQVKNRSIAVKRPAFKSLFFHSPAVQPWVS